MALTIKSKLRFTNLVSLSSNRHIGLFYFCSASEDENEDSIQNPDLTPDETQTAEKLHFIIKTHRRNNPVPEPIPSPPNASHTIASLSRDLNQISAVRSISPAVITRVLEKCGGVRRGIPAVEALAFFNWAVAQEAILGLNPEPFNEMVDLAGKVKLFNVSWHIINLMKTRGVKITTHTFTNLIRRYIRADCFAEGIHTFNRMEEYGCEPDKFVFSVVIAYLCKKRQATEAQSFFESLKDKFEADVVIYTSLISGWCRSNDIPRAEKLLAEMKSKGVLPNVYTYSILIDGLCRSGQRSRAHDVLAEMIDIGCEPNAVTFNNFMRVHAKANRTLKVLQIHNQMKGLRIEPDVVSYNFLIESHCKDNALDEAVKVLNVMEKKKCQPKPATFNPIFRLMSKRKDVNGAHRLYARMKAIKCRPDTVTYNVLMQLFANGKSADMVLLLKEEMDKNEIEPNVKTFQVLIEMFCAMGHWNNAYKYMKECIEDKCLRPSSHNYQKVLELLRNAGQLQKHEELVEKMIVRGFAARPL